MLVSGCTCRASVSTRYLPRYEGMSMNMNGIKTNTPRYHHEDNNTVLMMPYGDAGSERMGEQEVRIPSLKITVSFLLSLARV